MVAIANKPTTRDKKRSPVLDGVRGLCALGVLWGHVAFSTIVVSSAMGPKHHSIWQVLAAGQLSLGPFFIMSGWLLYRPFARRTFGVNSTKPALGKFFLRRASRIVPAFWLVVTFDLLVLNYSLLHGPWDVLRPYVLAHVYDFHYYLGMDVLWTVPTEMQFYLALPVIAWIMHLLARRVSDPVRKARLMLIPLALMVAVELGWETYVHHHYGPWPPQFFYPFSVTGLFALGMAMAVWSALNEAAPDRKPAFYRLAAKRPYLFWLGAAIAYAVNCAQPFGTPGTADWQTVPAFLVRDCMQLASAFLLMVPLIVPGATRPFMEKTLGNPVLAYLGRISYGIYLWHFTIMYLRFQSGSVFGKTVPVQMLLGKFTFWELFIPTVLGTVAAASLSYYLVERPVIKLVERKVHWKSQSLGGQATAVPASANGASPAPERREERRSAAL